MRMDVGAVMARIVEELKGDGRLEGVKGELTSDRQAGRAQIRIAFTYNGEERAFLYHVRREGPAHTVARSMIDDTFRTLPQRILEGIKGRLQPNDVYYPSALGNTPTIIPGQPSGVSIQ